MTASARTIALVRHAETSASVERRYLGWSDAPLTAAGRAAAAALATRLHANAGSARSARSAGSRERADDIVDGAPIVRVYSSDLGRALETARLALPGAAVQTDARLRELNFGGFEGRTYEENLAEHGARFRAWIRDPYAVRPPDGELLGELEARLVDWLASLPSTGRIIAFTHAGAMHALRCHVRQERFDPDRATRFGYCDVVPLPIGGDDAPAARAWPWKRDARRE